jgi:hypothetical protein
MALVTAKKPAAYAKKRTAGHHNQGKHYLKAYWPYIPMLVSVVVGLMISNLWSNNKHVLGVTSDFTDSALLKTVNSDRSISNVGPLALNYKLEQAAQSKAEYMVSHDFWSHTAPDGKTPWLFITSAGYSYKIAAENLAFGFDDARSTVIGWMNSPDHRANILNSNFQDVGFGIASSPNYLGKGPEVIIVAEFAAPTDGIAGSAQKFSEAGPAVISRIQLLTGGNAQWSTVALSALLGAGIALYAVHHGFKLRRFIKKSEKYIMKHPTFDMFVVLLLTIGFILTSASGSIH